MYVLWELMNLHVPVLNCWGVIFIIRRLARLVAVIVVSIYLSFLTVEIPVNEFSFFNKTKEIRIYGFFILSALLFYFFDATCFCIRSWVGKPMSFLVVYFFIKYKIDSHLLYFRCYLFGVEDIFPGPLDP